MKVVVIIVFVMGCRAAAPPAPPPLEPGARVTLRGRISDEARQHRGGVMGKKAGSLEYGDGQSVVVYWDAPPACSGASGGDGEVELTGTVIDTSGPDKRGSGWRRWVVLDVESARCVDRVAP